VFAALDSRYSSVIFMGVGLSTRLSETFRYVPPDVNPLHFLPHIQPPKLMLHGLYDDGHPLSTSEPIFQLMREPKKRGSYIGGHVPAPEIAVPLVNAFLDETLAPVARK